MGLRKCPDCGREVSDKAPACPYCGRPIATGDSQQPTQLEGTAKSLKLQGCLAALLAVVGIIMAVGAASASGPQTGMGVTGVLLFLVAMVWGTVTRIRRWWRHG